MPVQGNDGKLPLEVLAEAPKEVEQKQSPEKSEVKIGDNVRTKRELFEELYKQYSSLPYKRKEAQILADMTVFFPKDKRLPDYVKSNLEKKK